MSFTQRSQSWVISCQQDSSSLKGTSSCVPLHLFSLTNSDRPSIYPELKWLVISLKLSKPVLACVTWRCGPGFQSQRSAVTPFLFCTRLSGRDTGWVTPTAIVAKEEVCTIWARALPLFTEELEPWLWLALRLLSLKHDTETDFVTESYKLSFPGDDFLWLVWVALGNESSLTSGLYTTGEQRRQCCPLTMPPTPYSLPSEQWPSQAVPGFLQTLNSESSCL